MKKGVSCFIFAHNQSKFIVERLRSVERQTVLPDEIIIVDDGSSDGTQQAILNYLAQASSAFVERARCLFFDQPTGKASGRWLIMLEAKYEFLWLLEGDDSSEPTFLSTTSHELQSHSNVGIIWTWSKFVNEKGTVLGTDADFLAAKPFKGEDLMFILSSGIHRGVVVNEKSLVYFNPFPNLGANLFRSKDLISILKVNWGEIKNLRLAADWLIYSLLLRETDLYVIASPLNIFRRHSSANSYQMKNIEHLSEYLYLQTYIANKQGMKNVEVVKKQKVWAKFVSDNLGL